MSRSVDAMQMELPSDVSLASASVDTDALGECKYLIGLLGVMEQMTSLGMSEEPVQVTSGEMFGLFHLIKRQVERIESLLDPEEG